MDKLKQWVALTVVGCLAVLAGGWFLLVSPQRDEAADLRAQTASAASANQSLRTQLAVLKAQAKDLPQQQAKLAAVAAKIPESPALPALIRALDSASAEAGVDLVTIAPGAPAALVAAAPVAAPVAAAPGAAPAPAAAAAPAPVAAVPAGLQAIPLSINAVGGYFELQQFVGSLEDLGRALRITALSLAPGTSPTAMSGGTTAEDGRSLAATITGEVYLAKGATTVTPAVVPAGGIALPAAPTVPAVPAQ